MSTSSKEESKHVPMNSTSTTNTTNTLSTAPSSVPSLYPLTKSHNSLPRSVQDLRTQAVNVSNSTFYNSITPELNYYVTQLDTYSFCQDLSASQCVKKIAGLSFGLTKKELEEEKRELIPLAEGGLEELLAKNPMLMLVEEELARQEAEEQVPQLEVKKKSGEGKREPWWDRLSKKSSKHPVARRNGSRRPGGKA